MERRDSLPMRNKADLRSKVLDNIRRELGDAPTLEQVVEHLLEEEGISRTSANRYVVKSTFYFRLSTGRERTVRDLEAQMSADLDIPVSWVRELRSNWPRKARKKVAGISGQLG